MKLVAKDINKIKSNFGDIFETTFVRSTNTGKYMLVDDCIEEDGWIRADTILKEYGKLPFKENYVYDGELFINPAKQFIIGKHHSKSSENYTLRAITCGRIYKRVFTLTYLNMPALLSSWDIWDRMERSVLIEKTSYE